MGQAEPTEVSIPLLGSSGTDDFSVGVSVAATLSAGSSHGSGGSDAGPHGGGCEGASGSAAAEAEGGSGSGGSSAGGGLARWADLLAVLVLLAFAVAFPFIDNLGTIIPILAQSPTLLKVMYPSRREFCAHPALWTPFKGPPKHSDVAVVAVTCSNRNRPGGHGGGGGGALRSDTEALAQSVGKVSRKLQVLDQRGKEPLAEPCIFSSPLPPPQFFSSPPPKLRPRPLLNVSLPACSGIVRPVLGLSLRRRGVVRARRRREGGRGRAGRRGAREAEARGRRRRPPRERIRTKKGENIY